MNQRNACLRLLTVALLAATAVPVVGNPFQGSAEQSAPTLAQPSTAVQELRLAEEVIRSALSAFFSSLTSEYVTTTPSIR